MSQSARNAIRSFKQELSLSAALLVSFLALAGCGGGGVEIASVGSVPGPAGDPQAGVPEEEPPVSELIIGAPLAPTPALTSGTYDTIALVLDETDPPRFLAPGSLSVTVDSATNTYSFTFDPDELPELGGGYGGDPSDGQVEFGVNDETYGHEYEVVLSENGEVVSVMDLEGRTASLHGYLYDEPMFTTAVGESHVSLGQWNWPYTAVDAEGHNVTGDWITGGVVYVYGDRTAPEDIPVSGTATYTVVSDTDVVWDGPRDFNSYGPDNLDMALTADFGEQSIAAAVQYDVSSYEGDAYHYDLSGDAPISALGNFDIALHGSQLAGTFSDGMFAPGSDPASTSPDGQLVGAFFGPDAAQIGGTMAIPGFQDFETFGLAFVAAKQ